MPNFIPSLLRAILIWLLMMAAETVQGGLRRFLFDPDTELLIRQVSVVTGAVVIFVIAWFTMRWLKVRTVGGALAVGALWVALTVIFEIAVGRIMGVSEQRMLADYDLMHGGLMPFGLLAMSLTPWAVLHLRRGRNLSSDAS